MKSGNFSSDIGDCSKVPFGARNLDSFQPFKISVEGLCTVDEATLRSALISRDKARRMRSAPIAKRRLAICSLGLCLPWAPFSSPLLAIDGNLRIEQLYHSAWTPRDGAPADIYSLAQGTDGVLWIGAGNGLYRFDGIHFSKFDPTSGPRIGVGVVRTLFVDRDGTLWVGTNLGVISRINKDVVTDYGELDGAPAGTTVGFAKDQQGGFWVSTTRGVARWDGSRWRTVDLRLHASEYCMSIHADRSGGLWVGTSEGLFHSTHETQKLQRIPGVFQNVESFADAPDGKLWIAETGSGLRPVSDDDGKLSPVEPRIPISSEAIFFDDRGSMWIATTGNGIRRATAVELSEPAATYPKSASEIDQFRTKQGLTNDYASTVLQDREGNVWIGTKGGLDLFRQAPVIPVAFPSGLYNFSLARDQSGNVWVSSQFGSVGRIEDGRIVLQDKLRSDIAIYAGAAGLWLRHGDALLLYADGHLKRSIRTPAGAGDLIALTEDRSGVLWASFFQLGEFRFADGRWTPLTTSSNPPPHIFAEFADPLGAVWFGSQDNAVFIENGDAVRKVHGPNAVGVGMVRSIHGNGNEVWIGGTNGAGRWDGSRFLLIHPADRGDFSDVTGVIVTHGQGLWLAESMGIVFVSQEELDHFIRDSRYRVLCRTFGALDGLALPLQNSAISPTVVEGLDGKLWFATATGMVWIDPKSFRRDTLPPPVSIESFAANGRNWPLNDARSLPPHTRSVRVDYAAWSMAIPQRVYFRYRLEGLEKNWQDAGTQREVSYTNLDPGHYTFHVLACNPDGVWNTTGASFTFEIAPAWYQSLWFRCMGAVAALAFFWWLNSLRIHQATAQLQLRLEERLKERERIARELHDTLLQGFDGLVLRFQTALDQQDRERGRQLLAAALDRADAILLEGRERVFGLRTAALKITNLHKALESFGAETAEERGIQFSVNVLGYHLLHPFVRDEVYRIGREVLANAFQHSQATKIETEIDHRQEFFSLRIRDNGIGMDERVSNSGRGGHWGLTGMRERARELGGELKIDSHPGQGTDVTLIVPARAAYSRLPRWFWPPWLHRDL